MAKRELSRRDFAKLTTAAFGGVVSGAVIGCKPAEDKGKGDDGKSTKGSAEKGLAAADEGGPQLLLEGKNVCRGLNHTCANHKGGDNTCAGQGMCATAKAHTCHEANDCKGEGGCGANPGQNACKGKGDCAVPLGEDAWTKARATFEAEMNKVDKKFGKPPEPASS